MFQSRRLISVSTIAIGLALSGTALAGGPALEANCGGIVTPTAGVTSTAYTSEDCNQLFVLPPAKGSATVTAVSTRANLNFCPAVLKVGDVAKSTIDAAAIVADKLQQMIEDFDPLSQEVKALGDALAEADRLLAIEKDEMAALDSRKLDLVDEVATTRSNLTVCQALGGDCTIEQQAVTTAVAELKAFLLNEYVPGQRELSVAKANAAAAQAAYTRATSEYAEAVEPLFGLMEKLISLNASVNDLYKQYTPLTGFVAGLNYSSGWDAAVANFQSANPNKTVYKMPIKRPRMSAAAVGLNTYDAADAPGILAFAVPGVINGSAAIDMTALPPGTETGTPLTQQLDANVAYENAFSDNVGAQAAVSLNGACTFYPNGLADQPVKDINQLTAEIKLNAFYTYDLAVRRGYTAQYNLSEWASRVEKVTKKGGFFSSKTLHSIVEDSGSSDWFKIEFDASSAGFTYTAAEQDRITTEVKGQLQERALVMIARQMNYMPSDGKAPPVPPRAPTGAGLAASYLMRGCGYWSWCLGGSFVLGVLDSIFGSSSAVSEFKKSNSAWVTEQVRGIAFMEQTGGIGYE